MKLEKGINHLIGALILAAVMFADVMTPTKLMRPGSVELDKIIPATFGNWVEVKSPIQQQALSVNDALKQTLLRSYDDTLMRTYVNKATHDVVMLALAYGQKQRQEIRIHRPEGCYVAQGSDVSELHLLPRDQLTGIVPYGTYSMFAKTPQRAEQVLYWIRIGDTVPVSAFKIRREIFWKGLQGYIPDGMLVRTSQIIRSSSESSRSVSVQQGFLNDLIHNMGRKPVGLLIANTTS